MSPFSLRARDDSSDDSSSLQPTYIAGIVLAGVIVAGVILWLAIRQYRQRSKNRRDEERGAAFLSVRGIIKEGDLQNEKESLPESSHAFKGNTFSRTQITPSIVLPDKVLTREPTSTEVLEYHRQSGTFPRPFAPKPFSFALSAGGETPKSQPTPPDRSSWVRQSFMSTSSARSRYSVMSSSSSVDSSPTTGSLRKVRQLFNPVLPDELLINLGDKLTVVQSFDDGWCVVGREVSIFAQTAKSLFKSASGAPADSDVELGVVPAWCFLKPTKGLKAERPMRSTSLGITVQMDGPGFSSREEIISWSNF